MEFSEFAYCFFLISKVDLSIIFAKVDKGTSLLSVSSTIHLRISRTDMSWVWHTGLKPDYCLPHAMIRLLGHVLSSLLSLGHFPSFSNIFYHVRSVSLAFRLVCHQQIFYLLLANIWTCLSSFLCFISFKRHIGSLMTFRKIRQTACS